MTDAVLRPARPDDLDAIMGLIGELAAFEQLPGPDAAARERLRRHVLAPPPGTPAAAEILVAETAHGVVAYALTFMTYSTFLARPTLFLEDLFVHPSARGHGIGTAMLEALRARAIARECGRFEWLVLDWNTTAIRFYERLGAKLHADWRLCRIDLA